MKGVDIQEPEFCCYETSTLHRHGTKRATKNDGYIGKLELLSDFQVMYLNV